MRSLQLAFAMAMFTTFVGGIAHGGEGPLAQMGWLSGCWRQPTESGLTEEQWMAPRGMTMIGMSRTVVNGETVFWEILRIEQSEGRLELIALPSGQAEAQFAQVEISPGFVAFENPEHDFPQRISYRKLDDGSLLGRIEGEKDGQSRAIDFPLRPVACEDSGD